MNSNRRLFIVVTILMVSPGCHDDAELPTRPVVGRVCIAGAPARGVQLRLHPCDEQLQRLSIFPRAVTDADGQFEVSTYVPSDGAPEGDYQITASWRAAHAAEEVGEVHPDEVADGPERLAADFLSPATTPLRITVPSAGTTNIEVELRLAGEE